MKKAGLIAGTLMLGLALTGCGKEEGRTTEIETATINYIEPTTEVLEKVASGGDTGVEAYTEPEASERDLKRSGTKDLDAGGYKITVANLNLPKEDFTDDQLLQAIEEYRTRMDIRQKITWLSFTGYSDKGYLGKLRYENDTESQMEFRNDNGTWKIYMYQPGVELDEYGSVIDDDEPTHN